MCCDFFGSILLILSNTKYFRGVDTAYIKQNAVLSGGRCYFYKAINIIFGESMLLILSNTTQYYRGVDTAYTEQ